MLLVMQFRPKNEKKISSILMMKITVIMLLFGTVFTWFLTGFPTTVCNLVCLSQEHSDVFRVLFSRL